MGSQDAPDGAYISYSGTPRDPPASREMVGMLLAHPSDKDGGGGVTSLGRWRQAMLVAPW